MPEISSELGIQTIDGNSSTIVAAGCDSVTIATTHDIDVLGPTTSSVSRARGHSLSKTHSPSNSRSSPFGTPRVMQRNNSFKLFSKGSTADEARETNVSVPDQPESIISMSSSENQQEPAHASPVIVRQRMTSTSSQDSKADRSRPSFQKQISFKLMPNHFSSINSATGSNSSLSTLSSSDSLHEPVSSVMQDNEISRPRAISTSSQDPKVGRARPSFQKQMSFKNHYSSVNSATESNSSLSGFESPQEPASSVMMDRNMTSRPRATSTSSQDPKAARSRPSFQLQIPLKTMQFSNSLSGDGSKSSFMENEEIRSPISAIFRKLSASHQVSNFISSLVKSRDQEMESPQIPSDSTFTKPVADPTIAPALVRPPKILLLGASDSGKTTLLNQFKSCLGLQSTAEEKDTAKLMIRMELLNNILKTISSLVEFEYTEIRQV